MIMNLNKIKLFGILMSVGLFITSCSNDDDNNSYSLNKYNKNSENLIYTGDASVTALGAEFTVEINNGKGTLTATNAIIGSPNLKFENIDFTIAAGKSTFSVTDSNADRDIILNGAISDGKLTIEGDLTFKNSILGTWEMPLVSGANGQLMGIVDWSATVKSDVDEANLETAENTNGMLGFLGDMIGGLIGSEIDQLTIVFSENGAINAKYRTIIDNQIHEGLPLSLALNYFIRDGKLFIAMSADLLKVIPSDIQSNEVIQAGLSLIKEEGGYAYIELKTTEGDIHTGEVGSYTLFYVDDAVFSVLSPILVKYVQDNIDTLPIPNDLEFMGMTLTQEQARIVISNIVAGLPYQENYKFGLGFKRSGTLN